jgi:hypothetical protein
MADGSGAGGKGTVPVIAGLGVGAVLFLLVILLAPLVMFTDVFASGTQDGTPAITDNSGPVPGDLIAVFNEAARVFQVNPYLLASVAEQESSFGTGAGWDRVNFAGCVGFMQTCVGGAGGNSWGGTVKLTATPRATLIDSNAFSFGQRPSGYAPSTTNHPDYNDAFDGVMAGAVELRGKVGGQPIPRLDQTAYRALCGYYGACADSTVNYAEQVLGRAQQWADQSALSAGVSVSPGSYVNPLRQIRGLIPERVDEGVDYAGSGPLLAVGDGTVFFAASSGVGWPRYASNPGGGGFVGYTLTDGAYAGDRIYVAENVDPLVSAGQKVRAGQPIANLNLGGANLETGWASGNTSQPLAALLGQGDPNGDIGAWMSAAGWSFNKLLIALGAPSGVLQAGGVHGTMPRGYP